MPGAVHRGGDSRVLGVPIGDFGRAGKPLFLRSSPVCRALGLPAVERRLAAVAAHRRAALSGDAELSFAASPLNQISFN